MKADYDHVYPLSTFPSSRPSSLLLLLPSQASYYQPATPACSNTSSFTYPATKRGRWIRSRCTIRRLQRGLWPLDIQRSNTQVRLSPSYTHTPLTRHEPNMLVQLNSTADAQTRPL